jgi:nitrite reductase (NO-forming)
MFSKRVGLGLGAVVVVAAVASALGSMSSPNDSAESYRTDEVAVVDFATVRTPVTPAYDARIAPATPERVRSFRIPVTHETIEIAEGVTYDGWTFGGTVPGPTIRARQGDKLRITLVNQSPMPHSIDFHSARIAPNQAYRSIAPGEEIAFEFVARDPGVYVVHCGTPPVTLHLMQGMYLTMIVDPEGGWGSEADKEFVITQSEFYAVTNALSASEAGSASPDLRAAMDKRASHVTFNGKAFQYRANPLEVDVGDRVRFFVANAGPSFRSDFHVVGAVFDRVFVDGDASHPLRGVQTWSVPAGGGAVFETVFADGASGVGVYPFVTHAFADADKGAIGLIRVGNPTLTAGMGH